MATVSATSIKFGSLVTGTHRNNQLTRRISRVKFASASETKNGFPSLRASRFTISCNARPETVEKVCEIVKKQLALPAKSVLTPESKFSALGADSLDTVEIVMALEEHFGISVEEESSQTITTIEEASNMIEKLVEKKDG